MTILKAIDFFFVMSHGKRLFFLPFEQFFVFIGHETLQVTCVRKIHANFFFEYENIFYIYGFKTKYWCMTMYTCEKSPPPYKLSYFELLVFSQLSLSCVGFVIGE